MRSGFEARRTAVILSAVAVSLGGLAACSTEKPALPPPPTTEQGDGQDTHCAGLLSKVSLVGNFKGFTAYRADSAQPNPGALCVPILEPSSSKIVDKIYPEDVRAVPGPPIFACMRGNSVYAALSRVNAAESLPGNIIIEPRKWGVLSATGALASRVVACPLFLPDGSVPDMFCAVPNKTDFLKDDPHCFPIDPSTKV
jgi:hypothetical protein